jgi:hypothetical protein
MKSFQLRLNDETYETIADLADRRESSIADVIRNALELFAIADHYSSEGQRLYFEDRVTGEKTQLVIPGLRRPKRREERALAEAQSR